MNFKFGRNTISDILKHKTILIWSGSIFLALVIFTVIIVSVITINTPAKEPRPACSVSMDYITSGAPCLSIGALSDYEIGEIPLPDNYVEHGYSVSADNSSDSSVSDNEAAECEAEENEYANLAIANVDNYVNVRVEPTTESDVVGKIYDGAVAEIVETVDGEGGQWFKVTSGNVEGYMKAEYFIYGNEAAEAAPDYVTVYATVTCNRLNVRSEATTDSSRIGYVESGEKVVVSENLGDWLKVVYSGDKEGYISADYVRLGEEFTYARTIEEDNAIKEEEARQLARETEDVATAEENLTYVDVSGTSATYTTNSDLRTSIVNNAMQYLGNRYVSGGSSLAGGTDCSGFTSLLYAQYGYALSRTPQGQYTSNGRSVSYEQAQPGDIVCYSSNGSTCTHVGIYIGNGQIIHSSTPSRGVITANITSCGTILAIKNVID